MEKHIGCRDVYENCKHYKVSKYCNRFLLFTTIFTILVVLAIILMHKDFSNSQQKIIEIHNEHLLKTEACFTSIHNNLKNEPINCDSLIIALESDKDLAKKITNYSSVKKLILELANNMSYRAMADELKKDSLLINRQLANSQHATNELLELNFNRIQHEYTVLALWAGVLMIVFLIFSFYSLYKTDDIAKQGKESLQEIVKKGDDVLSGLNEQQQDLMDKAKATLAEVNKKADESQNQIDTLAETFRGKISTLEVTAVKLEQLFQTIEKTYSTNSESSEKSTEVE